MTTTTAHPTPAAPATDRVGLLRTVLLVDGVGTAALGAAALLAARPLSDAVATPGVLRGVGVLLLVVGVDMLLARRLPAPRLRLAARLLGAGDLVFAAALLATLPLAGATPFGTAVVLATVAVCLGMGAAKLRLGVGLPRQ